MSLGRPRGGIIGGAGADSMSKGPMLGHDLTATLPISKSFSYLTLRELDFFQTYEAFVDKKMV